MELGRGFKARKVFCHRSPKKRRSEMSAMFDDAKSCGAAGLGSGRGWRRLSLSTESNV